MFLVLLLMYMFYICTASDKFYILLIMKKNILFICAFILFTMVTFAQSPLPVVSTPSDIFLSYFDIDRDDFKATRILDAKIGADGNWYCLVELEAPRIGNRVSGSIVDGPYLIPGGGLYIRAASIGPTNVAPNWYKSVDNNSHYNPNTVSPNEIVEFKSYSRYAPTGKEGAFMWFKATYLSPTEVGIYYDGQNITPSNSGSMFEVIYTAAVTVKTGTWPFQKIKAMPWYVQMSKSPLSPPFTLGPWLVINLKIKRPN